jgi:hypothetical protein
MNWEEWAGSSSELIKVLSLNLPGGTEEIKQKTLEVSVSQPKVKPDTCSI